MSNMTKKTLVALVGAAFISTSASAGNLVSPAADNQIATVPVFEPAPGGSLGSASGAPVVLGVLGLLVLGAAAAGGGS